MVFFMGNEVIWKGGVVFWEVLCMDLERGLLRLEGGRWILERGRACLEGGRYWIFLFCGDLGGGRRRLFARMRRIFAQPLRRSSTVCKVVGG